MASPSPVGISPALLQAITHLHKSRQAGHDTPTSSPIMVTPQSDLLRVSTDHLLQGMNQSVAGLASQTSDKQDTIIIMPMEGSDGGATMEVATEEQEGQREDNFVLANGGENQAMAGTDYNVGSVLTAIATHLKTAQKRAGSPVVAVKTKQVPQQVTQQVVLTVDGDKLESEISEPVLAAAGLSQGANGVPLIEVPCSDNAVVISAPSVSSAKSELVAAAGDIQPGVVVHTRYACPICGDKISGYHYGTYTCESCKGFFKRTVQNKKTFACHRNGGCTITMANRKKCPACRFSLCVSNGMKVEAIREDRARGGRSSYDGCSSHGRPKPSPHPQSKQPSQLTPIIPPLSPAAPTSPSDLPVTIGPTARTPQLLDDLTAVESLMVDEEEEQACCEGRLQPGDNAPFSSLLHLADHCLYRIVRWARNLPDFACVSTDDQIVLLQNCWAELLCVCTCWNSLHSGSVLRLSHGRTLSLSTAQSVGVGDLVSRLLDFTAMMRLYETDLHEFVAMKALLLLTPDVKNLKNESTIRQQQELLLEGLTVYTTTHYPGRPEKFSRLIALLPQLSRTCVLAKEVLVKRQEAGEVPPYSLLSELLKGDVCAQ